MRRIRRSQGLSQTRLGDMIGTSYSYVSNVERGIVGIGIDQVERIATALDVDPIELFQQ